MKLRATQLMLALLMAVPLHLCCWMGLMGKEPEAPCSGCHQFLAHEEQSETAPEPVRHCACCEGTLERDLTPPAIAAPFPTANDLPAFLWAAPEHWKASATLAHLRPHLCRGDHPPPDGVPFYQRHCALLI